MNMYVCAVFDKKVNAYLAPAFFRTRGEATRAFMDTVAADTPLRKHPEDYSFHYVGSWNDSNGQFENLKNGPEPLMTAMDCVSIEGQVN